MAQSGVPVSAADHLLLSAFRSNHVPDEQPQLSPSSSSSLLSSTPSDSKSGWKTSVSPSKPGTPTHASLLQNNPGKSSPIAIPLSNRNPRRRTRASSSWKDTKAQEEDSLTNDVLLPTVFSAPEPRALITSWVNPDINKAKEHKQIQEAKRRKRIRRQSSSGFIRNVTSDPDLHTRASLLSSNEHNSLLASYPQPSYHRRKSFSVGVLHLDQCEHRDKGKEKVRSDGEEEEEEEEPETKSSQPLPDKSPTLTPTGSPVNEQRLVTFRHLSYERVVAEDEQADKRKRSSLILQSSQAKFAAVMGTRKPNSGFRAGLKIFSQPPTRHGSGVEEGAESDPRKMGRTPEHGSVQDRKKIMLLFLGERQVGKTNLVQALSEGRTSGRKRSLKWLHHITHHHNKSPHSSPQAGGQPQQVDRLSGSIDFHDIFIDPAAAGIATPPSDVTTRPTSSNFFDQRTISLAGRSPPGSPRAGSILSSVAKNAGNSPTTLPRSADNVSLLFRVLDFSKEAQLIAPFFISQRAIAVIVFSVHRPTELYGKLTHWLNVVLRSSSALHLVKLPSILLVGTFITEGNTGATRAAFKRRIKHIEGMISRYTKLFPNIRGFFVVGPTSGAVPKRKGLTGLKEFRSAIYRWGTEVVRLMNRTERELAKYFTVDEFFGRVLQVRMMRARQRAEGGGMILDWEEFLSIGRQLDPLSKSVDALTGVSNIEASVVQITEYLHQFGVVMRIDPERDFTKVGGDKAPRSPRMSLWKNWVVCDHKWLADAFMAVYNFGTKFAIGHDRGLFASTEGEEEGKSPYMYGRGFVRGYKRNVPASVQQSKGAVGSSARRVGVLFRGDVHKLWRESRKTSVIEGEDADEVTCKYPEAVIDPLLALFEHFELLYRMQASKRKVLLLDNNALLEVQGEDASAPSPRSSPDQPVCRKRGRADCVAARIPPVRIKIITTEREQVDSLQGDGSTENSSAGLQQPREKTKKALLRTRGMVFKVAYRNRDSLERELQIREMGNLLPPLLGAMRNHNKNRKNPLLGTVKLDSWFGPSSSSAKGNILVTGMEESKLFIPALLRETVDAKTLARAGWQSWKLNVTLGANRDKSETRRGSRESSSTSSSGSSSLSSSSASSPQNSSRISPSPSSTLTRTLGLTLRREYHFDILPLGLFARLLMRLLPVVTLSLYWQTGCIVSHKADKALVQTYEDQGLMVIEVTGVKLAPMWSLLELNLTNVLLFYQGKSETGTTTNKTTRSRNSPNTTTSIPRFSYNVSPHTTIPCTHCLRLPTRREPFVFLMEECEVAISMGQTFLLCDHPQNSAPVQVCVSMLVPDVSLELLKECTLSYSDFTLLQDIAKGAHTVVRKGRYNKGGRIVAIKEFLLPEAEPTGGMSALSEDIEENRQILKEFRSEALLLSGLRHPNIVEMIGICRRPLALVTEFIEGGNMFQFLQAIKARAQDPQTPPHELWAMRLRIALDVARGIDFLHSTSPPIIHRDIKSVNILMTGDNPSQPMAKVGDFGIASFFSTILLGRAVDNPLWLAPEVMGGKEYSEKSDCYSFGICLWELWACETPFSEYEDLRFFAKLEGRIMNERLRPTISPDCPEKYAQLIRECWDAEPSTRPSFLTILRRLTELWEELVGRRVRLYEYNDEQLWRSQRNLVYDTIPKLRREMLLEQRRNSMERNSILGETLELVEEPDEALGVLEGEELERLSNWEARAERIASAESLDVRGSAESLGKASAQLNV